jgi:hypothetical protein
MSDATANGLNVLEASVHLPRIGVWRAELVLDGVDASKANGVVAIVAGDTTYTGTSLESGAFVGRIKVRMVGGAGGFGKATEPKFYHRIPAKVVINDLLGEGGERLSSTSDASKLGTILPFWTRNAGTVGEGLGNVLDEIGATWRVLPDGSVWIGSETWPTAKPTDVIVESESPQDSRIEFSSASPSLLPGTTFRDRKVSRVEHTIAPGKTRTSAWFDDAGTQDGDPLRAALNGLVRQATKHVDFYVVRAGEVVSQNPDGTLELKLDDPDMPGLSKIPIAYGIPGVTAKVKPKARVHVEFADGSPTKPRAVVIDSSALLEAKIEAAVKVAIETLLFTAKVGAAELEMTPASLAAKAPKVDLGMAPAGGLVTQVTQAPTVALRVAFLAAMQAFLNFPGIAALSGGTAQAAAAAGAGLAVAEALPTNYTLTVKAGP